MRIHAEYVGHDDDGNEVFLVTIYNPRDPDECTRFLHTEPVY